MTWARAALDPRGTRVARPSAVSTTASLSGLPKTLPPLTSHRPAQVMLLSPAITAASPDPAGRLPGGCPRVPNAVGQRGLGSPWDAGGPAFGGDHDRLVVRAAEGLAAADVVDHQEVAA